MTVPSFIDQVSIGSSHVTLFRCPRSPQATDSAVRSSHSLIMTATQVGVFQEYFVPAPTSVKWQSNNTLFSKPLTSAPKPIQLTHLTPAALWFGINDIGFSYINGYNFPEILPQIGASYNAMISILYAAGGES